MRAYSNTIDLNKALMERPKDLRELANAVSKICQNVGDNVSCTRPPERIKHITGKVEVYSLSPYHAGLLSNFLLHCRKTFTENTIRALFAFFGGCFGSMGRPINARGSIPYHNLSVRPNESSAQGGKVGSGATGGHATQVPVTCG